MPLKKKNLSDIGGELPSAVDMKFAIVVSQWNNVITDALLEGAVETLVKNGASEKSISVVHVPGSFELPAAAEMLAVKNLYDAVICLGCVIQGETRHFDFICQAVSQGIMDVSLKHAMPVIFGVLTTQNMEQAIERAGGKHGNKGVEAAAAAISMASIKKSLR